MNTRIEDGKRHDDGKRHVVQVPYRYPPYRVWCVYDSAQQRFFKTWHEAIKFATRPYLVCSLIAKRKNEVPVGKVNRLVKFVVWKFRWWKWFYFGPLIPRLHHTDSASIRIIMDRWVANEPKRPE